jgi:hypothetical protein
MFDHEVPNTIYKTLSQLYTLDVYDGVALGLDGMSAAYRMPDPANP